VNAPRPIPDDPGTAHVLSMIDAHEGDPWLIHTGDLDTFAAETMNRDGSGFDRVVLVQIECRENHTTTPRLLRVVLSPEDAAKLAGMLAHTGLWLIEHERRNPAR
jgi:hypothetical protein